MVSILFNLAKLVATGSVGYFVNDAAGWVNKTFFPTVTLSDGKGGFKWWYVLIILVVLAGIAMGILWMISQVVPKSKRK